ncbi:MAG: hypothetical protein N2652_02150 [Kiritimatiellae bacterium]|nr:hypothetical protein [Kiritimatiellia bacterium]
MSESTHRRGGAAVAVAAALAIAAAYAGTAPRNRTEAEDTWDFAWKVERAPARELLHPHHLLHLPVMRTLWAIARRVMPAVRAHTVMAGASAVAAGATVVLVYALLRCAAGAGRARAAASAAVCAVSYGVWRYAAEAEAYAPAAALALAAWWCAARSRRAAAAVAGAAAIGMHIFALPAVGGAVPLWLWRRRGSRAALAHGGATVALAALAYAVAGVVPTHTVGGPDPLRAEGGFTPSAAAKATLAFGSTVASANFLFGEPAVAAAIARRFPARMTAEEEFLGRAIPELQRRAARGTLALTFAVALTLAVAMLRGARGATEATAFQGLDRDVAGASNPWTAFAAAAGAWFATHALLLLVMEPGNPELWVMALPPLWLAVGAAAEGCAVRPILLGALAGALGAHNWLGGLEPLRRPEGDLHRARARAVLRVCTAPDQILTAGGPVFFRYLRYHAPPGVTVVDLWSEDPPPPPVGGRCLVMGDVFRPPPALRVRFPGRAAQLEALTGAWRSRARLLAADPWDGIWELSQHPSPAALPLPADGAPGT